MTKPEPILKPDQPGDLRMIVEALWAELQDIERNDPENRDRVRGCAMAAHEALSMWLGLKPVAEVES